jgi:uncharacterized protein
MAASLPRFLAVIHVAWFAQARIQARIALKNGAGGIFLISHGSMGSHELLRTYLRLREEKDLARAWIGVNYLGVGSSAVLQSLSPLGMNGIWTDGVPDAPLSTNSLRFCGIRFKHQKHLPLPEEVKRVVAHADVAVTSGAATGIAPTVEDVLAIREELADFMLPLAVASGMTPENVREFRDHADCFMVATGISKSFTELDPGRVRRFASLVG